MRKALVGNGQKTACFETSPLAYVVASLLFDPSGCGVLDGGVVAAAITKVGEH